MRSLLFRFAFVGLAVLTAFAAARLRAHDVTVYSYVTDEGRKVAPPTADRPVPVALVSGGAQELGLPAPRRVNFSAEFPRVANGLGQALLSQGFEPLKDPASATQLIVFHWGFATPPPAHAPPEPWDYERRQMLTLVGGRALPAATLDSERNAIVSDAGDERYFVIVSAYDYAAYAHRHTQRLLWRTQLSVSGGTLTPAQAWPLLAAVGAHLFNRDTRLPQRTAIEATGRVIPLFKSAEK